MELLSDWLTVRTFAQRNGVDERTVQRWLKAGKLPGAVKTNRGWTIPANAVAPAPDTPAPPAAAGGRELAVRTPAALEPAVLPRNLAEALDAYPAYLPLAVAARLLGVAVRRIRENPEAFGAVPYGRFDALLVPARTVRETAGL